MDGAPWENGDWKLIKPFKLEEGKYYKNRKGEKVGPIVKTPNGHTSYKSCPFCIIMNNNVEMTWAEDGKWGGTGYKFEDVDDLIEEWNDEIKPMCDLCEENKYPLHDPINHPQHYTSHPSGIECIEITRHMSFTLGNAMKYIWRADLKNGVQDLRKALWYIQDEIDKREKKGQRLNLNAAPAERHRC